MKKNVKNYSTLVFDCDGVILDSNKVKTDAFYQATISYGGDAARAMVEYHVANGGVSRYKKFRYFLNEIVNKQSEPALQLLLDSYASHVREGLMNCDVAKGLELLRNETSSIRWLIVSGGDQSELRDIFAQRGMSDWFDGGIFGSPDIKEKILINQLKLGNIKEPALCLGDSIYDYKAAKSVGLDFVFVSDWTEVKDWKTWVEADNINSIESLYSLLD